MQAEIVYRNGDKIGARRTFIQAYERLVNESMMNSRNVEIFVSLDSDRLKRTDAINHAVFAGSLTQEKANHYLYRNLKTPSQCLNIKAVKKFRIKAKLILSTSNKC